MTVFLDRAASVLAAIFTFVVCGGPAWFSHVAIREGVVPVWGYGFVAGLAGIGLLLSYAFMRKALRGIAPSRQRRR